MVHKNRFAALIRSAALVVVNVSKWRSMPMLSLFLRARRPRASATRATPSVAERRIPSCLVVEGSTVVCNSGTLCHMSHALTGRINLRESNAYIWTASGARYQNEDYGDRQLTFEISFCDDVPLLLRGVAHEASLNYHFLFLRAVTEYGHTCTGNHEGVNVFLSFGGTLCFHLLKRFISPVRKCWYF